MRARRERAVVDWRWAWRVALWAMMGAALVWALTAGAWSGVIEQLRGLGWAVGLALLPPLAIAASQTLAWRSLLRQEGHELSIVWLLALRVAAQAQRMSLPGGAAVAETTQVLGLVDADIPLGSALASVAAKKVLTLLTNALLALMGIVAACAAIHDGTLRLPASHPLLWMLVGMATALVLTSVGLVSLMRSQRLVSSARGLLGRLRSRRIQGWLERTTAGWEQMGASLAASVRWSRDLTVATAWLCASWALEVFETWWLLSLLGAPVAMEQCLVIEVMASLLKSLAFASPGGLGAQDAAYVAMLEAYGVAGAGELAVAFVLLERGKDAVWTAVGYALLIGRDRLRNGRRPKVAT